MKKTQTIRDLTATFHATTVAQKWRQVVRESLGGVLVFSPYITSRTAESVLGHGTLCEVHTLFEAELFASGASATRTLLALLDAGHALFAVPDLHAKIVIVKDRFVSVGSQNLTFAGTKRNELTVAFDSAEASAAVRDIVAPWIATRTPITREMLEEMESMLGPAQKMFEDAKKQSTVVQKEFERRMEARAERERVLQKRIELLANSLRQRQASRENVRAVVRRAWSSGAPTSLIVSSHNDLTRWNIGQRVRRLEATYRYLCINEETGQIGWARVMTTRITYVSGRVIPHEKLEIGNEKYGLRFSTAERDQALESNLGVHILRDDQSIAKVNLWFSADGIERLGITTVKRTAEFSRLEEWIERHSREFERFISQGACEPFRYLEGHLSGREAASFFGPIGSSHTLRLVDINDHPVIVSCQTD